MIVLNPVLHEIQNAHKAKLIHSYRCSEKIVTVRFTQETKKEVITKIHTHLTDKYTKHIQSIQYVGTHSLRIYLYEKS